MAKKRELSKDEEKFVELIVAGLKATDAYSKAFGVKVDPHTAESQKARNLPRLPRISAAIQALRKQEVKQAQVEALANTVDAIALEDLRQFAYDRLVELRDDKTISAIARFNAIKALERLNDPSKDVNLMWRWIDLMWRGYTAHCPCCHANNPLWKLKNIKLDAYREKEDLSTDEKLTDVVDRRLFLLKTFDKRKVPHKSQLPIIAAPERHLAGMGAARAGKSLVLAWLGALHYLIPGVHVWILGRIYEDTRWEVDYIEGFLKSAFFPVYEHMVHKYEDKKSGEIVFLSRWGSEFRVKSGKAQGSITGCELEACLVGEPAWVDQDLFEEVRARMSSRMGRILAFGTPKGYGGFLNRMLKMTTRTFTGRKIKPEDKLVANGCPWSKSLAILNVNAEDNPAYVKSEKETAKEELTESEYASEFEGLVASAEGAKFPCVQPHHRRKVKREELELSSWILGCDQGERNFGACLQAWDGHTIYTMREFFDKTDTTIKANMIGLNTQIPAIVRIAGGNSDFWRLTAFDADPPVHNILLELDEENRPWKTEITYRPKNKKEQLSWRTETCLWLNELAKAGNLVFDESCDLLHEQVMEALRGPEDDIETDRKKGWIIRDQHRGDHVVDAWLLGCYFIMIGAVKAQQLPEDKIEPFEEQRRAWSYMRLKDETEELTGYGSEYKKSGMWEDEQFTKIVGHKPRRLMNNWWGHYPDE